MRNEEITRLAQRKVRKKQRILWGRLISFIIVLLLLLATSVFAGVQIYKYKFSNNAIITTTVPENATIPNEIINKRVNILFLGIDDGDSEAAIDEPKRTDAILLVSMDPAKKQISILSVPRDSYVMLPGFNKDKANSAFFYGGVSLAKKTMANFLQVPIHYYVLMDWDGFNKIIDILGGIDIYVESNMNYEDPYADLQIHLEKGFQHLDGVNSGKYIRFRSDEMGDIGRVQRQQKFVRALLEQHLTLNTLGKIPDIAKALDTYIQTDIPMLEMIKLINTVKGTEKSNIKSAMVPGEFMDVNKVSYWRINDLELKKVLNDLGLTYIK